jgi:hypothetical protein
MNRRGKMSFGKPLLILILLFVTDSHLSAQEFNLCYRLSHTAVPPSNPEDANHLPVRIALGSGSAAGQVISQANPLDNLSFWSMFQNKAGHWSMPAKERLKVSFSNGFTVIVYNLDVHSNLVTGVATIQWDVIGVGTPTFKVTAQQEKCPEFDSDRTESK